MSIPILNQLNEEIQRLFIAGSALAKDDPRLQKYLPPLQKLGEKAPIFQTLADKLAELIQGDPDNSPEQLMDIGMLLYSVLYTQINTSREGQTTAVQLGKQDITLENIPYSKLNPLIDILKSNTQAHAPQLEEAYQAGYYNDPRLYEDYVEAIGNTVTYVSTYIIETIIPAIGPEMIPFVESSLNIAGGKRDARLFAVLYQLKGVDILPLAEKILADGAQPVLIQALYALSEDVKYEEILIQYSKDRKSEVKQAAFAALTKLNTIRSTELLLEALQKAKIGHLCEALLQTNNQLIITEMLNQAQSSIADLEQQGDKAKVLLRTIAGRDEEEGLIYLESLLNDPKFYEKSYNILDWNNLIPTLYEANTNRKNLMLLDITSKYEVFHSYYINLLVRMFSPEEVYDQCHKLLKKTSKYHLLNQAYHVYGDKSDAEKNWDRRWGTFLAKQNRIPAATTFMYDDDIKGWEVLLNCCVSWIKNDKKISYSHAQTLVKAFKIGHPKAGSYYKKFVTAGGVNEYLNSSLEKKGFGDAVQSM